MKNKENCDDLLEKKRGLEAERDETEKVMEQLQTALRAKLINVGNIVHDDVPVSVDEVRVWPPTPWNRGATAERAKVGRVRWARTQADNRLERAWPEVKKEGEPVDDALLHHFEVLQAIDAVDTERGTRAWEGTMMRARRQGTGSARGAHTYSVRWGGGQDKTWPATVATS